MIAGYMELEDFRVQWKQGTRANTMDYTVMELIDSGEFDQETFLGIDQADFLSALAIAIHNDGMSNAEQDYPAAERVMGRIRWIS